MDRGKRKKKRRKRSERVWVVSQSVLSLFLVFYSLSMLHQPKPLHTNPTTTKPGHGGARLAQKSWNSVWIRVYSCNCDSRALEYIIAYSVIAFWVRNG